jgi:hypothetical protein
LPNTRKHEASSWFTTSDPDLCELCRAEVKRWMWTQAEKAKGLDVAWAQMLAMAEKYSQPQAFADDFHYWDRKRLREALPDEFVWILRNHGTWSLIPPDKPDVCGAIPIIDSLPPGHSDKPHFFHWYNGELDEITQAEAKSIMLREWNAEFRRVRDRLRQDPANSWRAVKIAQQYANELVDNIWKERGAGP